MTLYHLGYWVQGKEPATTLCAKPFLDTCCFPRELYPECLNVITNICQKCIERKPLVELAEMDL